MQKGFLSCFFIITWKLNIISHYFFETNRIWHGEKYKYTGQLQLSADSTT